MLPKYTFALGGTDAVKQFMDFVNSQEQVKQTILLKSADDKSYAIGDDSTFEKERDLLKGGE